jgi:hypothetical protein
MAITRPDGLGDIANLGLTLSEAKQLLVQVQHQVVTDQATAPATIRPDCRQPHRIATLFGEVRLRLPRFLCAGCGGGGTGISLAIALSVDP